MLFRPHFYMPISALSRLSRTRQKFSKRFFFSKGFPSCRMTRLFGLGSRSYVYFTTLKGLQLYFEISPTLFIHQILEGNFCQYVTVYLVRKWTYENGGEKFFQGEAKADKKRILCKSALNLHYRRNNAAVWIHCQINRTLILIHANQRLMRRVRLLFTTIQRHCIAEQRL